MAENDSNIGFVTPIPTYVLGVDVSSWNKFPDNAIGLNWKKAHDNKVEFAFLRAMGFSGTTPRKDRDIDLNWKQTKENGILRGAYVFWVWVKEVKPHIDMLKTIFPTSYDGELPLVLDLEPFAAWGTYPPKERLLNGLQQIMIAMDNFSKRSTIFYSNPDTIKNLMPIPDWLKQRTVWVANYNVNTPQLYNQWSKWNFWQMTDRLMGENYGMDSKQLDGNYWNGTLEELQKYCGSPIVIDPTPVLTLEQRVTKLENWAKTMGYK